MTKDFSFCEKCDSVFSEIFHEDKCPVCQSMYLNNTLKLSEEVKAHILNAIMDDDDKDKKDNQ